MSKSEPLGRVAAVLRSSSRVWRAELRVDRICGPRETRHRMPPCGSALGRSYAGWLPGVPAPGPGPGPGPVPQLSDWGGGPAAAEPGSGTGPGLRREGRASGHSTNKFGSIAWLLVPSSMPHADRGREIGNEKKGEHLAVLTRTHARSAAQRLRARSPRPNCCGPHRSQHTVPRAV